MTRYEAVLLEVLKERSFRTGEFQLASGAKSNYYIDCRLITVSPTGSRLIGKVFNDRLHDLKINAVGGMEAGAIPIITSIVMSSDKPIEGFWCRDKFKSHGSTGKIVGWLEEKSSVVLVDDVTTTGQSTMKAVEAVTELNCKVIKIISLVDRLQGAKELFAQCDIPFDSIFTIKDFGVGNGS